MIEGGRRLQRLREGIGANTANPHERRRRGIGVRDINCPADDFRLGLQIQSLDFAGEQCRKRDRHIMQILLTFLRRFRSFQQSCPRPLRCDVAANPLWRETALPQGRAVHGSMRPSRRRFPDEYIAKALPPVGAQQIQRREETDLARNH